ncbi:MAG: lipase secretion chaperone [Pseudomonadota bacterium]
MANPLVQLSLAAMLVVAASGLTLYWQWPVDESAPPLAPRAAPSTPGPVVPAAAPAPAPAVPAVAARPAVPPLLPGMAGTEIDGDLKTDAAGNLILDLAVRDYFDYFLSAADQAGLEAAVGALVQNASGRLQEPALGQLSRLLGDYLDYKRASMALMEQPLSAQQQADPGSQLTALQQAFDNLAQLRREHLSAAASEAFFGAEEAYGRYTLAAITVQAREDLSAEAKAAAVEALRGQLPEAMRNSEERQVQALAQQAESTRLWQDGASEEEVRRFFELTYDPPTVERLLAEQRADRAWQQHYDAYRQELANLTRGGLSVEDQQVERERLRQRLFTVEDQHRVETYDAIAAKQNQTEDSPGL